MVSVRLDELCAPVMTAFTVGTPPSLNVPWGGGALSRGKMCVLVYIFGRVLWGEGQLGLVQPGGKYKFKILKGRPTIRRPGRAGGRKCTVGIGARACGKGRGGGECTQTRPTFSENEITKNVQVYF